jgi:hypothetical protein
MWLNDWWTSPNTFSVWFSLSLCLVLILTFWTSPKGICRIIGGLRVKFITCLIARFRYDFRARVVLSEEWLVRQHWIIKWKQSCRKFEFLGTETTVMSLVPCSFSVSLACTKKIFFGITVLIIWDKTGTVISDHSVCSFRHTVSDM